MMKTLLFTALASGVAASVAAQAPSPSNGFSAGRIGPLVASPWNHAPVIGTEDTLVPQQNAANQYLWVLDCASGPNAGGFEGSNHFPGGLRRIRTGAKEEGYVYL